MIFQKGKYGLKPSTAKRQKRVDSIIWNHPLNCDYFRTSVLFGAPDSYRFVGGINGQGKDSVTTIYSIELQRNNCGILMIVFGY